MIRPTELTQLLTELEAEIEDSSVTVAKGAKAVVYTDSDPDKSSLTLTANECRLLFHSEATVAKFHKTLNSKSELLLALYGLTIDDNVREALEYSFVSVDDL